MGQGDQGIERLSNVDHMNAIKLILDKLQVLPLSDI